ncbi:MAG: glycoside hydrolase 5 family protein [Patescibacteria group bacterium]
MRLDLTRHRFGVNYTPARSWWYCWNDFEPGAVAADLDAIAGLGADHIRIMLIWPYFQPNPRAVSGAHLERLDTLMALAGERRLDVCAALFTGWLSGYAFKPPYQADASFYLPESAAPQELYLQSVADLMKEHGNFLGFDLGNELNCCWRAGELETGDRWSGRMLALAAERAPSGTHVNGVDHQPWFGPATFSPRHLAAAQKIVALHCWTYFTGALARGGGDCFDPRCLRLPEAMAALARAYAGDPKKPVWLQEYGMSEAWADPQDIPRFLRETTQSALRAGVNWFTWWSSHDLDRRYAFDPLEYSLGLIAHDQRIKPQGYAFKELAEAYRGREAVDEKATGLPDPPRVHNPESTWRWIEQWLGVSDA